MLGDGLRDAIDPYQALRRRQCMHASRRTPHSRRSPQPRGRFKVEDGVVEAVRDISFQVDRGEMIALVGESGSGKSVTARAIMRLLPRTRDGRRRESRHRPRRRATSTASANGRCCAAARQPHLDDLPGADVVAEPGLHGRQQIAEMLHPAQQA